MKETDLSQIVAEVCGAHGVDPQCLSERRRSLIPVRQEVCYRAMMETDLSSVQIGKALGLHHSTILYASAGHAIKLGKPIPRGSDCSPETKRERVRRVHQRRALARNGPRISLDLPLPPSVNQSRKIDWAGQSKVRAWRESAGIMLMAARPRMTTRKIPGQFEATIVLSEKCRLDPDNAVKSLIDFARRFDLITDDSPKYFRRLVVEFGEAPEGCKLILREAA